MSEWFSDEEFWKNFAPVMFSEKRWAEASGVVDSLIQLVLPKPLSKTDQNTVLDGLKILDLCCGMGRVSSELARRGFAVTGVDLSAALLEAAREDAACEKLKIEYIQADARSFKGPLFFDIAVNLYTSFGYFEDPEDDLLLARNVFESLKPGGSFVIETLGKEIAARDFTGGEWFERDGFTVLTEYEAVESWSRLKNRWVLIKNTGESEKTHSRIEKVFTQRLYSAVELCSLLHKAGFNDVDIYGGWDERPYNQNAAALIAVGKKN